MGRRKNGQYLFYIALAAVALLFFLHRYRKIEGFQDTPIKGLILNLQGGLGNQLFIYAGGLTMKNKYKVPLYLLPLEYEGSNIHSKKDYRFLFDDQTPIEYTDPLMLDIRKVDVHIHFFGPWNDIPAGENKNIYIKNHWFQDFPSIKPVFPQVKREVVGHLSEMYKDVNIDKKSSAFIHVRRGDYTKEAGGMYALDINYYNSGLEELNKSDSIKIIYIFSDDIAWCKQQVWNTTKHIEYIDEPDEMKVLYMMSQCEGGAVISNSTFSSWGAMLGPYMSSDIIVYPSKWLFNGNLSLPTEWIKK